MSQRLQGKTAFITAAGQGIGRAIVEAFVREGATVIATDLNAALLHGVVEATGCRAQVLDATDAAAIRAAAASAGPVDVLVNAAGFVNSGTVLDCTEAEWDFAFNLNVRSQFRTIQAFLPGMLVENGGHGGSIINLASVAGSIKGAPSRFVYGSTKAAVIGLTKAVAADYIKKGVRANAICPGTIQSPSLDQRIKDLAQATKTTEAAARQAFIDRQPMGRLGTAEEIAALAVYLAADESSYTTGQIHLADGGFAL